MTIKVIENFETNHDTCSAIIQDNELLCILETERVSKHKHANFENPAIELTPYLLNQYKIKDYNIISNDDLKYYHHHELHALSSFLSSGYKEAAIVVIDAIGDQNDGVTLFVGKDKDLFEIKKYNIKYSLGIMYAVASLLIYGTEHSEGKLMGLSCCSEPEYTIPSPIQYKKDGSVEVLYKGNNVMEGIKNYLLNKFSYLLTTSGIVIDSDIYKAKIAATVQYWFTEQVINIIEYIKSIRPDLDSLCLAGGCFLNCETNGIIDRLGLYKNIYCNSAPADNGLILGKVQQVLKEPIKIDTPYFGVKYNYETDRLKSIFGIDSKAEQWYSNIDNIINLEEYSIGLVINKLKEQRIIIWFDGNSEFGPRALGHRSFLADPSTNEMFWKLSVKIKEREKYRPLAPITTDKLYDLFLDDPNPQNLTAFMLKTVKVKEEWINKLRAITHVNKTARPQRLTRNMNSELYDLINLYYEKTGIPCLINTSLNLKNQPLLETYSDLLNMICDKRLANSNISVVLNHKLIFDIA